MVERRAVSRISVGKSEGRIPLGRPSRRCVGYIKKIFFKVGCGGMNWVDPDLSRKSWRTTVNAVMNLWVP